MPTVGEWIAGGCVFVIGSIFGMFLSSAGAVAKVSDLYDEIWDKDKQIIDLRQEVADLRQQLKHFRNTPYPVRGL